MKQFINKLLKPFKAEIHGSGYIQMLQKGEFRKDAYQHQKDLLGHAVKTIFDIGANRGDVTERYLQLFPTAQVHSFEPFPGSFNTLTERFNNHPNVQLIQKAVSNNSNPLQFHVNANVDTNSLLASNDTGLSSDKAVQTQTTIDVNCTSIDEYCEQNNITHIDVLKMDIQGGEYNALLGAEKMLTAKKIKLIYTESFFVKQYKDCPLFYDIANLLFKYDYPLVDISNPYYGNGKMAWCDATFMQQDFLK
jgi:FkbM family methyltransferase